MFVDVYTSVVFLMRNYVINRQSRLKFKMFEVSNFFKILYRCTNIYNTQMMVYFILSSWLPQTKHYISWALLWNVSYRICDLINKSNNGTCQQNKNLSLFNIFFFQLGLRTRMMITFFSNICNRTLKKQSSIADTPCHIYCICCICD